MKNNPQSLDQRNNLYTRAPFHDPTKPYMSMSERAAQFMPFKALGRDHNSDQGDNDDDATYAENNKICYNRKKKGV